MSDSIRLLHHSALYILLSQVIKTGVNLLTQMIRSPQPFRDILLTRTFLFIERSNQRRSREENGAGLRGSFARAFVRFFPRSSNKPPVTQVISQFRYTLIIPVDNACNARTED